jgi:hypothetical protein
MRIYVPATLPILRKLIKDSSFAPLGGTAFALTPALRESYATGDTEELEYVAMRDAARASLRLMSIEAAADQPGWHRRAVVAADLEDVTVRPDLDDAVVRVAGEIPASAVAAVHIDEPEAEYAVSQAAAVMDAADMGDPDAEFVLGSAEDHELAWYAPSELPFLLELLDL